MQPLGQCKTPLLAARSYLPPRFPLHRMVLIGRLVGITARCWDFDSDSLAERAKCRERICIPILVDLLAEF